MNFFDYPYPFLDYHFARKGYLPWPEGEAPLHDNIFRDYVAPTVFRLSKVQL